MKEAATLPIVMILCGSICGVLAQTPDVRTSFRVKYVAGGSLYLDGGRSDGLAVGMSLNLERVPEGRPLVEATPLGRIVIIAVASNSVVCEFSPEMEVRIGDLAILSAGDATSLRNRAISEHSRTYPQVVAFTADDALDEEQREYVPRPPLPEVNRVDLSVSLEYSAIVDHGSGSRSTQEGVSVRSNMTRIGGSYWNFGGYWRGRRTARNSGVDQEKTLSDLLNRTYHIGLTYNNPNSNNVIGVGRLLLPWASSLSTLDGAYYGRRVGHSLTLGLFGGSTPDPTAWNYDPDRLMTGLFGNLEKGGFEGFRYSGTFGAALTHIDLRPERQFAFAENSFLFKRIFSIYHNIEADYHRPAQFLEGLDRLALSRSFLTFRAQPTEWVSFDLSHNYFQTIPTPDPTLVGTGLLDKILFEGLSGGIRLKPVRLITLYSSLGRSEREGDAIPSWNYQYGLTLDRLPLIQVRADMRMSRFDSSFGRGTYYSASLSRTVGDILHFEVQAGDQRFRSALTSQNRSRWINSTIDWFIGSHLILGAGGTRYRGGTQNYDQWFFSGGFRF